MDRPNLDRHARAALRKELQRAEEEYARLPIVITYLRERLGEEGNGGDAPAVPARVTAAPAPKQTAGSAKRITAADAAEKVLRERKHPMRTPELLLEVRRLGAQMKSNDNLFRTLVGNPKFKRVGRGLWALTDWPEGQGENRLAV
jgi:hypothetical protein